MQIDVVKMAAMEAPSTTLSTNQFLAPTFAILREIREIMLTAPPSQDEMYSRLSNSVDMMILVLRLIHEKALHARVFNSILQRITPEERSDMGSDKKAGLTKQE